MIFVGSFPQPGFGGFFFKKNIVLALLKGYLGLGTICFTLKATLVQLRNLMGLGSFEGVL